MEVKEYCNNMTVELAGWKSKVERVMTKLDHVSTGEKERVVPEVNELHMINDELNDRIEGLRFQCPTNWTPSRGEDHEVTWPKQVAGSWDTISVSDIGG